MLRLRFVGLCWSLCSLGSSSGRSVWQAILFSFYLTLLFDACCEGWGFEKILLRFALTFLVFVASYARLPSGSRFHLKHQRLNFPCNALYREAATTKLWVGSDNPLQCAVPSRYHFNAPRALYYNARCRFGAARALHSRYRLGTASVPLGPSITLRGAASDRFGAARAPLQCAAPSRYRFSTARVLHYNARCRLGAASRRLGPLLHCAVPTPGLRFTKV